MCDWMLGRGAGAARVRRARLRFARAFEFILGDVVVADTMADGRRLAFGQAPSPGACAAHALEVELLGEVDK